MDESDSAPLVRGARAFETSCHGEGNSSLCHSDDDDGRPKRTGTVLTAAAHIITAVIGSGVLSLPWSMAQLGWIAGPIVLFTFAIVTYYMSLLLADCYRSPDIVTGKRNYTYMQAVKANLDGCHFHGTYGGVVAIGNTTETQKAWLICQALGNVAFAYSYSMILIEIQDTLKSPPPENKSMRKATSVGIGVTTIFYMLSGCVGYAAFGNDAPGNILMGFESYGPYWLIDFANACVVVHLVGAYQVFSQPVYACVEEFVYEGSSGSGFIYKEFVLSLPMDWTYRFNIFQLLWRSAFVVACTLVAMLLPFFNDILGILGALGFWPLTVYYPVEMFIAQMQVRKWTKEWLTLQVVSATCLLISVAAAIGSIEGVIQDLKVYKPFKTILR
ncbi:hypothetical protein KP509_03G080300 [Ceratopteris richardii]|uniref:Amino acid transporter transmembrane domain-containing protein n=1 Tax=Ceratopteris richardii TaxID=49495 RepID=A0A8T2V904_CERRI|nr:hypothetical protein KP509_03G080300 [Ceratopteris richardii]